MRKSIAVAAMGAALIVSPTAAHAKTTIDTERSPRYEAEPAVVFDAEVSENEKRYLDVRDRFTDEFGLKSAGRNIVRDGFQETDGDVVEPDAGALGESTERMQTALNPPEPAPVASSGASTETVASPKTVETTEALDTSGAPTEVIECESGGDYAANTGNGYYGAYQFDQSTWDAYAPSGYAGTVPSEAPAEVQDATAAAIPYDAWPSC